MADSITPDEAARLAAAVRALPPVHNEGYQLTVDYVNGCLVMRLTGLVLQPVPEDFQIQVEHLIRQGAGRQMILDLSTCSYISSAVIGILIRFFSLGQERVGQMVVVRPPERVEKVMRAIGLDTFFLFVDTMEVAMQFFTSQGDAGRP